MSMADERIIEREAKGFGSLAEGGSPGRSNRGKSEKPDGASDKKQRPTGVKVLLWILRKSIVPLIMIIMLVGGLYIGYVVIGKQPSGEVFNWSTWKHMYDLVFAES